MTKKERGRNRGKRQRSLGRFVYPFGKLDMGDVGLVGGKNASLGEMFRHLSRRGVRVPDGFAVGSDAYWHFIDGAGLRDRIAAALKGLDATDVKELAERGKSVRQMVLRAEMPDDLIKSILAAYRRLSTKYRMDDCDVA